MQSEGTEVDARRGEDMLMDVSTTGLINNVTQRARAAIQVW